MYIVHTHSQTRYILYYIATGWSNSCSVKTKMDSKQFSKYLQLLDHPIQLPLNADVSSLYYLYREHITRFSYQSLDLWLGKPIVDLSISALLQDLSLHGGHCYQHSELMIAALEYIGFEVHRIAAWVLMNREYQDWMPLNHNFIQASGKKFFQFYN